MGELNVRLVKSEGWRVAVDRCSALIDGLINFPDHSEMEFYIGCNQEDRVLHRYFEHGCPETYLLYRTTSLRFCQNVERALIEEFRSHPRSANRIRGGGGLASDKERYVLYICFR